MTFQKNVWYVAALSDEVGRDPFGRNIVGQRVVFYRQPDGAVAALADRCPHRFAPLSMGHVVQGEIACKYHGLRFDNKGTCTFNPHGEIIGPKLTVQSFPVVERYGLIWIWPGDAGLSNEASIPDLSFTELSESGRTLFRYIDAPYRHDILVDNLLDLSHADYLHDGSFSSGPPAQASTKVRSEGDVVIVERRQHDAPAPPSLASTFRRVDQCFVTRWQPGHVMTFEATWEEAGDPSRKGISTQFAHMATPSSPNKTHYFVCITQDRSINDDEEALRELLDATCAGIVSEDGVMLSAVDAEMEGQDLMTLRPAILPTDVGALRVRSVMKRLVDQELRLRDSSTIEANQDCRMTSTGEVAE